MSAATMGVYVIRNAVNGKVYVGSSVRLHYRLAQHRSNLVCNRHENEKLQRAWNKYGAEAFIVEVVEAVGDRNNLLEREQHWIDALGSIGEGGYNICLIAGSNFGVIPSAETRQRMAAAHTGRKHTAETKAKMSRTRMGQKHAPESIEKMRQKVWSAESLAKLSAAARSRTPEHNEKISKAKIGKPLSAESIAKREATKRANGSHAKSPETRKRMSEAMKVSRAARRVERQA